MKYFETIKSSLAKCFYFPNQTHLFNTGRVLVLLACFVGISSFYLFLFYEANSVIEYVRSAYMCVTALGLNISIWNTISKTEVIFILIDTNIGGILKESG